MPKVDQATLRRVQEALYQYESEVEAAPLRDSTKRTYLLHARNFVRWLDDGFEPGGTLKSTA